MSGNRRRQGKKRREKTERDNPHKGIDFTWPVAAKQFSEPQIYLKTAAIWLFFDAWWFRSKPRNIVTALIWAFGVWPRFEPRIWSDALFPKCINDAQKSTLPTVRRWQRKSTRAWRNLDGKYLRDCCAEWTERLWTLPNPLRLIRNRYTGGFEECWGLDHTQSWKSMPEYDELICSAAAYVFRFSLYHCFSLQRLDGNEILWPRLRVWVFCLKMMPTLYRSKTMLVCVNAVETSAWKIPDFFLLARCTVDCSGGQGCDHKSFCS